MLEKFYRTVQSLAPAGSLVGGWGGVWEGAFPIRAHRRKNDVCTKEVHKHGRYPR